MTIKHICLAPGHGGFDPGAEGNGLREKDVNLTICLELHDLLAAAGVPVTMTRTTDVAAGGATDVPTDLRNQVAISDASGADLFFSVHVNAGGGHGAENYVYGDGGAIADLAYKVVDAISPLMGVHGTPVKDGSDLYVIAHTKAPAMLLEIGFIDSDDADKIKAHLHDYARLIAPVLIAWAGGDVATIQSKGGDTMPNTNDQTVATWAADAVKRVQAKGLMVGDENGAWNPKQPITREQMAVILVKAGLA